MPNSLFDVDFVNSAGVDELAALQRELTRLEYELDPRGGLRNSLTLALGMLHRYAAGIVHVDTGRLKNSLFWRVEQPVAGKVSGYVATNVNYAIHEERRGGRHAFFGRTVAEEGPNVNSIFFVRISGTRVGNAN